MQTILGILEKQRIVCSSGKQAIAGRRKLMRVTTAQDMGNLVRDRRKAVGLTQAALAELAGVSRPWLQQVEGGHGGASLAKLLNLLGVLDYRMDVDEKPPSRLGGRARATLRGPTAATRRGDES
jgi:y4mF family transcriptional regulator